MIWPLRSTDDVVRFLAATTRRIDAGELPRGYAAFAVAYHAFTLELLAKLTSGVFADPVRMADFIVRFCVRYQRALAAPHACAPSWQIAFAAARRSPERAVRNLVLGASAHMSYDLCAVIVELLAERAGPALERDVLAIDDVIDRGIAPVQRALAVRSSRAGVLAGLGGGVDVLVTWRTFARWRHGAWRDALAIARGAQTLASVEACTARRAAWLVRLPL